MKLPEGDTHFLGMKNYQPKIRNLALDVTKGRKLAVDIGAHVGFFSKAFCEVFERVIAFEPVKSNRDCLRENCNAVVLPFALGKTMGLCGMKNPAPHNSGAWELTSGNNVVVVPLDLFELKPDLIKIDVQGSTVDVLKGAVHTLASKPVMIVEAWANGEYDPEPVRFLEAMGASVRGRVNKDVVVSW